MAERPSLAGHCLVAGAGALIWVCVYAALAWPRLAGPVPTAVLLAHGALYTPMLQPAAQWPRLFTTWLLHVDALHLCGNLLAWAVVWLPASPRPGRRLAGFVLCGLGASLVSLWWYGRAAVVSVGPSGALLGLLVAGLWQRGRGGPARLLALLAALALLLGGVWTGGDSAAHAGGAACGLLLGGWRRARERQGG